MFIIPPPLFAGSQADISLTIDSDTYIGDLYTFLGSPSGKKNVEITVDGADVGEIIISTSWTAGSTFSFIAVNGGRILGEGGDGGNGAPDYGATGEAGSAGGNGTAAIKNNGTYPVSINVDDGFLFGGGGGGGGGSYTDTGTGGDGGGGGGGGQGWSGGSFGFGGNPSEGLPAPGPGTAGTRSVQGFPGAGGGPGFSATSNGGEGGTWGLGGRTGRSSNILAGFGIGSSFQYHGGLGGDAGNAYQGSNLTLSGSDSEATLRAAGRILGELGFGLRGPSLSFSFAGFDIQPTNDDIGIAFQTDGRTIEINTTTSPTASSTYYAPGASGANYQVRVRGLTGDTDDAPDIGTTPGTWATINTLRQFYWNFTGNGAKAALFEMRRSDIPGVGTDDVMLSFYLKVVMESEP